MDRSKKLKPNLTENLIMVALSCILILAIIIISPIFKDGEKNLVLAVFFATFAPLNFILFLRTMNVGFLLLSGMNVLFALDNAFGFRGSILTIPLVLILAAYVIFIIKSKMTWHYRKILELAAKSLTGTNNGFTSRPYPAGQAEYTMDEMKPFGNFLSRHLIAFPHRDQDRVVLVINRFGRHILRKPSVEKDTFVAFDRQGRVAVNIAMKDYQKFRDELTFDQLCESLARLFKQFLEEYRRGDKNNILKTVQS